MRTFSLLVLCLMGFFFMACDDDENRLGDWALGTAWPAEVRNQAVCFEIGDYAYVGLGLGIDGAEYTNFRKMNLRTGNWTVDSVAPFPGEGRHAAVAFVINGKAYVGLGYRVSRVWGDQQTQRRYFYDFYEYTPEGSTPVTVKDSVWDESLNDYKDVERTYMYDGEWRKIADFPHESVANEGGGRRDAVGFSFPEGTTGSNYGYVGLGRGYNDVVYGDFYSYNPNTNTWSAIRSNDGGDAYNGRPRYGASVFIVDGSAYICLGAEDGSNASTENIRFTPDGNGGGVFEQMQALTEKPDNKQDADYDRIQRVYAMTFTSNAGKDGKEYGYIVGGRGNSSRTVWRYDHFRDRWHQMEDVTTTGTLIGGVAFSVWNASGNQKFGMFTATGGGIDVTTNATYSSQSWWFFPDIKEWRGNDYSNTPIGQYRYNKN